jgi:2-keto-4-pentenoate hydratase/2-oxohepta-3-ene-1,7-dioic acid hydratase in catechol pathway
MRIALLRTADPAAGERFARLDGSTAHALRGTPWIDGIHETGESWPFAEADLACPVRPSKIVCIGRNYAAHARELGHEIPSEPLLFLKANSSLLGPGGTIVLPPESARVEHEGELVVVLGRRAARLSREDALGAVFGYTGACDVTARDLQRKDVQFTRSKSFDTFCPVGPWIETELDPRDIPVRCRIGGKTRQDGTTSHMIFDVPTIVSYVSHMMTLEPGDILLTGTPEGVGPIVAGDVVEVEIGGVGVLRVGARA